MSKTYGEDALGEYVLWENADGQINKKYITGEYKGEHQGYDPEHGRTFVRASDRSWETDTPAPESDANADSSSSGGSGCYIATATLQGNIPVTILNPLKLWRYTVLESTASGLYLSEFYRRTAPAMAAKVQGMPQASKLLYKVFVAPALLLVALPKTLLRDIALVLVFLTGMLVANIYTLLGSD